MQKVYISAIFCILVTNTTESLLLHEMLWNKCQVVLSWITICSLQGDTGIESSSLVEVAGASVCFLQVLWSYYLHRWIWVGAVWPLQWPTGLREFHWVMQTHLWIVFSENPGRLNWLHHSCSSLWRSPGKSREEENVSWNFHLKRKWLTRVSWRTDFKRGFK